MGAGQSRYVEQQEQFIKNNYHKYKNEQLNQAEEKEYIHTKEIYTKNMFVESRVMSHLDIFHQEKKQSLYYYLNETNKFVGSDITSILTEFNLHRLKINAILYYITKDGKYGYFNLSKI